MAGQILVALKSEDRLDQIVPYIEKVAQPGMKVVLLIRFAPTGIAKESRDNWVTFNPLDEVRFMGDLEELRFTNGRTKEPRTMEEHGLLAEHKVFLALEALLKRGVEIAVDVYTGSLRRVVKGYTCKGNVQLIMMRAGRDFSLMQLLRRMFSIFGWFKQPTLSPMLLLHPNRAIYG